jgi:predicted nucleic acid-binding protein
MAYVVVDTSILIEFLNPDNKVIQEFFIVSMSLQL